MWTYFQNEAGFGVWINVWVTFFISILWWYDTQANSYRNRNQTLYQMVSLSFQSDLHVSTYYADLLLLSWSLAQKCNYSLSTMCHLLISRWFQNRKRKTTTIYGLVLKGFTFVAPCEGKSIWTYLKWKLYVFFLSHEK